MGSSKKNVSRFSRVMDRFGNLIFFGFPRFLGDPKISRSADFFVVLRDFEGQACPKKIETRTSLQFSWDFEGTNPPKN
jgi:hypothetical protein